MKYKPTIVRLLKLFPQIEEHRIISVLELCHYDLKTTVSLIRHIGVDEYIELHF